MEDNPFIHETEAVTLDYESALHEVMERYHQLLEQVEVLTAQRLTAVSPAGTDSPSGRKGASAAVKDSANLREIEILHLENHKLKVELVRIKSLVKNLSLRVQALTPSTQRP